MAEPKQRNACGSKKPVCLLFFDEPLMELADTILFWYRVRGDEDTCVRASLIWLTPMTFRFVKIAVAAIYSANVYVTSLYMEGSR